MTQALNILLLLMTSSSKLIEMFAEYRCAVSMRWLNVHKIYSQYWVTIATQYIITLL
jgi:hypothetical protein